MDLFGPEFKAYFCELQRVERRETRDLWAGWLARFGSDRRSPWNSLWFRAAHRGRSVTRVYEGFDGGGIVFGEPGHFFRGVAEQLPPYDVWVEQYFEYFNDLYIWDAEMTWTLVIHHEQFGGLVSGPLLAYPL